MRRVGLVVLLVVASMTAGCGSSSSSSTATTGPLPAGPLPSPLATMICRSEVHDDINQVLGVTADVIDRAWVNHQYSCTYQYSDGSMGLSVKELSSWAETKAYFAGLETTLGKSGTLTNLGQAAFQAPNGSVVVRKDWKVLVVDPTGLPAQFGVPKTSAAEVAVTVADVVLGCWDGD